MMQTAAEEGARFIDVFLGPAAQDLATSRSLSPESKKKLDDLLTGKSGEHMILVKIWLPDATLVYSTNKETIGGRFPSPHITAALEGKATGEFDYLQDPENAAEKHLHTPLVEIYAPLFRTGTQEIIAVGEVYTDGRRACGRSGFDQADIRRNCWCSHGSHDADTVPDGPWRVKPGQPIPVNPHTKYGRGKTPCRTE